jgi:hypothetical protein
VEQELPSMQQHTPAQQLDLHVADVRCARAPCRPSTCVTLPRCWPTTLTRGWGSSSTGCERRCTRSCCSGGECCGRSMARGSGACVCGMI